MGDSNAWFGGPLRGELGSGALAGRVATAISRLETDGRMRIPSQCRVRRALCFLDALTPENVRARADDPAFQRELREHHRTGWEFFLITYAATITRRQDTPFLREKMAEVIRGADVDEGRDGIARNTQFELLVAAQLRLGGVSVYAGDPDLQFDFGSERVGIEAKRIRSSNPDTVQQRLREAASQIVDSGRRGFIAVNVDQRFESFTYPPTRDELHAAVQDVFNAALNLQRVAQTPQVLGVMVYGYTARLLPPPPGQDLFALQVTAPFRFERWVDDDSVEGDLFAAFTTSWQNRMRRHVEYLMSDAFRTGEMPEM